MHVFPGKAEGVSCAEETGSWLCRSWGWVSEWTEMDLCISYLLLLSLYLLPIRPAQTLGNTRLVCCLSVFHIWLAEEIVDNVGINCRFLCDVGTSVHCMFLPDRM